MGKPKNEGGVSKKNKVNRNGPTKAPHKQSSREKRKNMVKFVATITNLTIEKEKRKIVRKIEQLEKKLAEAPEDKVSELQTELEKWQKDLIYVNFFPNSEKYISLFPKNDPNPEEAEKKRKSMRKKAEAIAIKVQKKQKREEEREKKIIAEQPSESESSIEENEKEEEGDENEEDDFFM